MTTLAAAFLVLAAVLAGADWLAVARKQKRLEYLAKPATMMALIGVASSLNPASVGQQRWFLLALALGLLGDVFLMLPRDLFVPGLAAFLAGHLAYVLGFHAAGVGFRTIAIYAAVLLVPAVVVLPLLILGILRQGKRALVVPVAGYSAVITVMLASAFASRSIPAALGGLFFYASDTLIGFNRFVVTRQWLPLAIIVTYHLGQAGLVLSLVR